VIHPSSNIQKEYVAQVDQPLTPRHLAALRRGARIQGVFVKPLKVSVLRKNQVKISVTEGKKHEVRILIAKTGLKTLLLRRVRIGNLHLGGLAPGAYRRLSPAQCNAVFS